jgi:hypothetical protein
VILGGLKLRKVHDDIRWPASVEKNRDHIAQHNPRDLTGGGGQAYILFRAGFNSLRADERWHGSV